MSNREPGGEQDRGRTTHQLFQIKEIRDKVYAHLDADGGIYYDGFDQLSAQFQKSYRCECGARFYKEENAIEHIMENSDHAE